jgi:site-specific DNA recombinase
VGQGLTARTSARPPTDGGMVGRCLTCRRRMSRARRTCWARAPDVLRRRCPDRQASRCPSTRWSGALLGEIARRCRAPRRSHRVALHEGLAAQRVIGSSEPGAATVDPVTVGYTRLSLDKYGDLLGVTRQREDIVRLARSLGWSEITEFYEDNDVSANADRKQPRPEFDRLLHDIRSGTATHVLCYDQDRLVRDMRQLEDVVDAVEAGSAMLTSVNGDIDLLTDNGRMVARIKAAVARNEIEKLSRRIRRQKLQYAQSGGPPRGGRRTYGYSLDFAPVPGEAAVLVDLFRRKAAGESTASLVRWLNDTGVPSSRGNVGKWDHGLVNVLLRRRTYVGDVVFKGEVVATGRFEAIIDRAVFEAANTRLPKPQAWRDVPEFGLLTSLLVCGLCHGRMRRGRGTSSSSRLYGCKGRARGCGQCHVSVTAIDGAVREAVRSKVRQPGSSRPRDTAAWSSTHASAIEHEIEQARRMQGRGTLTRVDAEAVIRHLRVRLADERGIEAAHDPDAPIAADDDWNDWNLETQRDWLARAVRQIVVGPPQRKANGVHPGLERITVHFKDGEVRTLGGDKVIMSDLALLAGCSLTTVNIAIHGRSGISEATRQRVLTLARECGYVPLSGPNTAT